MKLSRNGLLTASTFLICISSTNVHAWDYDISFDSSGRPHREYKNYDYGNKSRDITRVTEPRRTRIKYDIDFANTIWRNRKGGVSDRIQFFRDLDRVDSLSGAEAFAKRYMSGSNVRTVYEMFKGKLDLQEEEPQKIGFSIDRDGNVEKLSDESNLNVAEHEFNCRELRTENSFGPFMNDDKTCDAIEKRHDLKGQYQKYLNEFRDNNQKVDTENRNQELVDGVLSRFHSNPRFMAKLREIKAKSDAIKQGQVPYNGLTEAQKNEAIRALEESNSEFFFTQVTSRLVDVYGGQNVRETTSDDKLYFGRQKQLKIKDEDGNTVTVTTTFDFGNARLGIVACKKEKLVSCGDNSLEVSGLAWKAGQHLYDVELSTPKSYYDFVTTKALFGEDPVRIKQCFKPVVRNLSTGEAWKKVGKLLNWRTGDDVCQSFKLISVFNECNSEEMSRFANSSQSYHLPKFTAFSLRDAYICLGAPSGQVSGENKSANVTAARK